MCACSLQQSTRGNNVAVADIRAGTEAEKFLSVGDLVSGVAGRSVLGHSVASVNQVRAPSHSTCLCMPCDR
jgi:hypothetical protein